MSYYIDKKYNYLKQFSEVADKLKNDITSSSSKSNNALLASQNDMNQNIKAARESKETKESELRTKYENSLKDIDATRDSALSAAKEVYEKSIERAEEEHRDERQKEITEMAKQLNEFNKNAMDSIVTMAPYLRESSSSYIAPVLEAAPTLDELRTQAQSRTYLQQVLVGIHKKNYNNKVCILPAYAEWQTMNDATTATVGNMMIRYDRQTSQKQALAMVNGMIYRMLMTFPVGSLHVSIIDPASIGVQTLTKWMAGSEELYNHQVYKNSDEITQHLKMLEDMIFPIKQEFDSPREISLVQHNKNAIKHGYELVILYDPFRERPSYGDRLRKLMNSGISAGIYVMIIQSDLMKPEVLQEFDFGSFSTVINANKRTLTLQKGKIEWDKKSGEFNSAYSIECDYLPNSLEQSELIDPLDETIGNGLVPAFFGSLKEDWKKVTKSRTTINWEDWNEPYNDADRECFTHGIKVPIGINDDTKEEMYFRVSGSSNVYAHSFVQGMTGSGKSKFLCTTISSIAMKYSPRAVQMYLFDFKDGLAFKRYEGAPHMRWLVTTRADKMMLLTVLNDLQREKERRHREFFDPAHVEKLEDYNKQMLKLNQPDKCLPRILLVVDECQDIYHMGGSKSLSTTQREINRIFNEIATQYRSAGIHLLLSSQQIPGDMTWASQLSNNYILNTGKAHFGQLLQENSKYSPEDIQKRIGGMPAAIGAYSTVDSAFFTMFAYEEKRGNDGNRVTDGMIIKSRAEKLLGGEINRYIGKLWNGKLDVPYMKIPVRNYMEFGSDTIGSAMVGSELNDQRQRENVLLYGSQGGDQAQQLTLRTVLTTLRGILFTHKMVSNPEDRPEVYVANAWSAPKTITSNRWAQVQKDPLEQSRKILENLAQHNYIHLIDNEQLKDVLLKLYKQIQNKEQKNVLLYILGANTMDVFRSNTIITDAVERKPAEKSPIDWNNWQAPSSIRSSSEESLTGLNALAAILREGTTFDIHTVLHINAKDDMENLGLETKDFHYMIFQQSKTFSYWPDNTTLELNAPLEELPIDPDRARTLFYDVAKPNEEQFIVPLMLDELSDLVRRGEDVGKYIMDNTEKFEA